MTRARDLYILTGILLLALGLRVLGLNAPLWFDEVQTLGSHLRLDWSEMFGSYEMNHHYFFNVKSKISIAMFGEHPWAMRLPALLFGVGTIWMIWVLARDLAGVQIAHASAFLLAIQYHHIWFSQNARGYTEMAFWGTLGTILFLRGLERRDWRIWISYALVLAAGVFTHLTSLFLFASHGAIWLLAVVLRRQTLFLWPVIGFVAGLAITLALYAPLLASLIETMTGVSGTSATDVMQEYQNPFWTILEGTETALGFGGPVAIAIQISALAAILAGMLRAGPVFSGIVLAHFALTLIALSTLGMRIWPRFFFADIGFVMILGLIGIRHAADLVGERLPTAMSATRLWGLALIAVMLVIAIPATRNYRAPKQNLAGAVQFVAENRRDGEGVFAVSHSADLFNEHFATDWSKLTGPADLRAALGTAGPSLFVITFPERSFRLMPELDDADLELLKLFPGTLGDGQILIFRRP